MAITANMYKKCPKCGVERGRDERSDPGICPACGLVFAKWVSRTLGVARLPREEVREDAGNANAMGEIAARLIHVEPETDPIIFWGRVALFVFFFVWGWYFMALDFRSNDIGNSFMHRVNLVFHEAGHMIFMPFGQFMHVLGGSLGQLLMPAIVVLALVLKNHDNFGGSVGLWWLGQSLKDLVPYINDARDLQLQLLTGHSQDVPETHDWANILLDLGLIFHEKKIAILANVSGNLIMLLAMAWGGYILLLQYRNLGQRS